MTIRLTGHFDYDTIKQAGLLGKVTVTVNGEEVDFVQDVNTNEGWVERVVQEGESAYTTRLWGKVEAELTAS